MQVQQRQIRGMKWVKEKIYLNVDRESEASSCDNGKNSDESIDIISEGELHGFREENSANHFSLRGAETGTNNHGENLLLSKIARLNHRSAAEQDTLGIRFQLELRRTPVGIAMPHERNLCHGNTLTLKQGGKLDGKLMNALSTCVKLKFKLDTGAMHCYKGILGRSHIMQK